MNQEINLLQDKVKSPLYQWGHKQNLFITILASLLIVVMAGYGGLIGLNSGKTKQIEKVKKDNNLIVAELSKDKANLTDAIAYQAQMENLKVLLDNHIYFSPAIKELTSNMYKLSTADAMTIDLSGKVHVQGFATSYSEVGKYLLGLYSSKNISDIKLLSVGPTDGETAGYKFSVDFTLKSEVFEKP
jgi:cell division protein FtsB